MRHLTRTILAALVPALLVACASAGSRSAPPGVTLSITPERPTPGSSATLTLRNDSEDLLGYDLCTSGLFRRTGEDAWEPVPEDRFCTMELRTLPPGEQATFPIELPTGLVTGTYRYQTTVELMDRGTREAVATAPFTVGG